MGFEQAHMISDIYSKIRSMVSECNRHDINDMIGFGIKQDLYQLKELVDQAIKACPEYPREADWLKKQDQKKIIKILKGDQDDL